MILTFFLQVLLELCMTSTSQKLPLSTIILFFFFFLFFKSHSAISEIDAISKNLLGPQNLVHTIQELHGCAVLHVIK